MPGANTSTKARRWPWRKLYCVATGPFASLPIYVRGLAAELLRYTDSEGRIWVGEENPVSALARLMGAHTSDRRMLRRDIPLLIKEGYLARAGGYLVLRDAQAAA